jgi:hypothetical protein
LGWALDIAPCRASLGEEAGTTFNVKTWQLCLSEGEAIVDGKRTLSDGPGSGVEKRT